MGERLDSKAHLCWPREISLPGRHGKPPLLSFIFTLSRPQRARDRDTRGAREMERERKPRGRRVWTRASDVTRASGSRGIRGPGGWMRRWEINKTVTYLPFPEAGLHAVSLPDSSVFFPPPWLAFLSFRVPVVPFAGVPPVSLPPSGRCVRAGDSQRDETRR